MTICGCSYTPLWGGVSYIEPISKDVGCMWDIPIKLNMCGGISMSVMSRYEKYVKEEIDFCMDDVLYIESVSEDDSAYSKLLDDIHREVMLNDDISSAIEKLIHNEVKRILDARGIDFE